MPALVAGFRCWRLLFKNLVDLSGLPGGGPSLFARVLYGGLSAGWMSRHSMRG